MSDWPKFVAAVCAEPDDDLVRMIAADWLDEHGQPERAEFCRVQCELAKGHDGTCTGPGADFCWTCERLAALRKRERELLVAQCGWFPDCMEGFVCDNLSLMSREGMPTFLVVRGFPSRLTLSWQDWQTHADALLAACPLTGKDASVRLTTWPEVENNRANINPPMLVARLRGRDKWVNFSATEQRLGEQEASVWQRLVLRVLAAEWPGVKFELPQGVRVDFSALTQGGEVAPGGHLRPGVAFRTR